MTGSIDETRRSWFIFPPWAEFSFGWEDLPDVFLAPERYGIGPELEKCIELGYSVAPDEHQFINGPDGGGLISVRRDSRRWFPAVLLRTQFKFAQPPGFNRNIDYGLHVLVPALRATHHLGEAPMPLAPSPFFSVDRIDGGGLPCFFGMGFDSERLASDARAASRFPALDLTIKASNDVPNPVRKAFEAIHAKQPCYRWYHLRHTSIDIRALLASVLYLGLAVAGRTKGSLRALHIFSSEFLSGIEFPSAAKWKDSKGRIRKASDW